MLQHKPYSLRVCQTCTSIRQIVPNQDLSNLTGSFRRACITCTTFAVKPKQTRLM